MSDHPIRDGMATVLQTASLDTASVVAAAAHILLAELATAESEACTACLALPGLCDRCRRLSGQASHHRQIARELGLVVLP